MQYYQETVSQFSHDWILEQASWWSARIQLIEYFENNIDKIYEESKCNKDFQ